MRNKYLLLVNRARTPVRSDKRLKKNTTLFNQKTKRIQLLRKKPFNFFYEF